MHEARISRLGIRISGYLITQKFYQQHKLTFRQSIRRLKVGLLTTIVRNFLLEVYTDITHWSEFYSIIIMYIRYILACLSTAAKLRMATLGG